MRKFGFAVIATAFLASGCAWTTSAPVDLDTGDFWGGIVYPMCKPLVAVTGSQISIIYMKHPNKGYAVRFGAFLAKNDVKLSFDKDCGLTKVESNIDTTAIIQLLQSALDKLAPDAKLAAGTASGQTRAQLYEVIFDDQGNIHRLKPLIPAGTLLKLPASDG